MNVDQLNSRFGAPGRIVFHDGFAGYPNVAVACKYGAAEIALLGANVLSYRPTGQSEVLFRPAKRVYNRGENVHCGVPVCWPQFGNRFAPSLPQHGFVRKLVWEVRGTEYTEEKSEVRLGLRSDAETLKLWPHAFDLEYVVSVSMKLNLTLKTTNVGDKPFDFSCGFHPYFLVRDRNGVTVKGLADCGYVDASGDVAVEGRQAGDIAFTKGYDHIFAMAPKPKHEYAILDAGLKRAIALVSSGNTKTVVWNPDTAYVVDDHGPEDWRHFVCIEPVSDWPGGQTLAPGASYELMAAVQGTLEN